MAYPTDHNRDRPWLMRTYAGHSSAAATNALYRRNMAKGQTGLSVAFDLPTQTGYDVDHELALGEVGKVGVPIGHLGDMRQLFTDISLRDVNTSMTINATAMWIFALYVALAEERGVGPAELAGTTQNDIIKEYLSRGTYIFPPGPSLRLTTDMISWAIHHAPKWNPINICSYHLQEVGATPIQEVAYALCSAIAVLDAVRASGQVASEDFGVVVSRISFFVNAGLRFVEEMCKMRAFAALWDEITEQRYGITNPQQRVFRYGVQVNSLGLTESQPENNVPRIMLEMLAVTMSKKARARAVQLPAWNEALGLPRPWDQQWALRMQQILAYETDLLEYEDIFDGSPVVQAKVDDIIHGAHAEIDRVQAMGGVVAAVENGYIKSALVNSLLERRHKIESGEDTVVGVNKFTSTEESPLNSIGMTLVETIDPTVAQGLAVAMDSWRAQRQQSIVDNLLADLRETARTEHNLMPITLACAKAGVTTGEWAAALREVFGEYRAPTGVSAASASRTAGDIAQIRERVRVTSQEIGQRLRILVGKPGLDGHSNGAEQVAVRARDVGFEVIYQGIRLTPAQIVAAAVQEGVHIIGLSVLSGSHKELVGQVLDKLREAEADDIPVVIGGIIPADDAQFLKTIGVVKVFTPKDYELTEIMAEIVDIIRAAHGLPTA